MDFIIENSHLIILGLLVIVFLVILHDAQDKLLPEDSERENVDDLIDDLFD